MFRRTKPEPEPVVTPKPGGKGRPTPTRKEAEALARAKARAPRTRKERAQRAREVRTENSRHIREAMKTGDERYLLPRDKGPVRRFIRDYVDSRFSIVELIIPLLIVTLLLGYSGAQALMQASQVVMLATFLFVIVDLVVLRIRVRKELARRFPGESTRGTTWYAISRSMQMKFMRMPKAKVKIGQALPEDYR
ncbi:DUF3043 domain-containing protein [Nocardioides silvaticus]|uniref:DUF3043 domain-containing protein n=1 Tax=Nocardioides silvaticus TaxID=2201891 RepID=A0A316TGC7_9ACTN|nr:DUF3043 domain-containing protein [Nocardioides silvaticus]PWN03510.1 DUF3043 domain-containing protein [Nocardioides silvaticus]